jgi:hypothetical protein
MTELSRQKLGIGVGIVLGVALTLAVLAVAGVFTSSDGDEKTRTRPARAGRAVYTLRTGDLVRDPLTATRCEASGEGGYPNLFCTRTSRARYQIVFYSDTVQVFDLQDPKAEPMAPKYSFKWISRKN